MKSLAGKTLVEHIPAFAEEAAHKALKDEAFGLWYNQKTWPDIDQQEDINICIRAALRRDCR